MKAPRKPFAWVAPAPSVIGPLKTHEVVPVPETLVPASGPVATTTGFSGASQAVPGGQSSIRYFTPRPVPPTQRRAVASSSGSMRVAPVVRSTWSTRPAYPSITCTSRERGDGSIAPMRITEVKTWLVQPPRGKVALFVKLETDAGIHGWGEAYTLTGREQALERMIQDFAAYAVGRDPFQIKHFTQVMWRDVSIKRGGFDFYCALSGLELAMWDIVGKAAKQPVYNLLGGPCRPKIRIYAHPDGPGDLAERCRRLVDRGIKAIKFDPFPGPWQAIVERDVEETAVERVRTVRETVGPSVEILIEVHRRLAPMHAVRVAKAIQQYNVFWFEEPTPAENLDATAEVRSKIDIPVVAGEALYAKADFRNCFEKRAADIIN